MHRAAHRIWSISLALIAVAVPAHAATVKRTSTGAPVHWPDGTVTLQVPTAVPRGVEPAAAAASIDAARATWALALDGTDLSLASAPGDVATDPHDGVASIRWATATDDPDIEKGVLGLTFVAYRTGDGAITDADVVLDAADFTWTTDVTGCTTAYDVESAVTHELGHLLGLAHSVGHPEATMFATATACETGKRDLAADDVDGLDELYRSDLPTGTCAAGGPDAGLVACALVLLAWPRRTRAPRRATGAVLVASLATTLGAPAAHAATLRRLPLAELRDGAAMVVRGRVIATAVTPTGPIATATTIAVDECLAGPCPAEVEVLRRGGERGGLGLWVDGEATLEPGTEVVLFLRADRDRLRVQGGIQGAFVIVRVGDREVAVRDLRGHRVRVDHDWRAGGLEAFTLADLRAAVVQEP